MFFFFLTGIRLFLHLSANQPGLTLSESNAMLLKCYVIYVQVAISG